ncbi:hypothetical protein Chor_010441 [Crotalus horridus]
MWNVAEELGAILVFAEHRYYGESLPFGNKSYTDAKHLNYLTSEQALADFAILIQHLKNTIPGAQNTPVIAIGGSYGGMLAAWFRMKYPHIVIGPLKTTTDVINFKELLREAWIYLAMVDYPYEAAFLQPLPAWPVKACTEMVMPMCSDGINDMFEPQKWDFHAYSEDSCRLCLSSPFSASNGGLDPWSGGGVTKNITDTLVTIMIPEGAHHLDLRANNPSDPISVLQARLLEVHYMKLWLQKQKRVKKCPK